VNRQLRQAPSKGNATVHVQVDISGTPLTYNTADNLGVLPVNSTSSVMDLAEWCGWDCAQWLRILARKEGVGPLFPSPCTLGHALAHYVDLHGPISKSLVASLAHFAEKPSERSRLSALVDRAAKDEYASTITARHMSVVDFLQEFPSVKPPLNVFLQLVPRLQPRLYTIASSSLVEPSSIHIAVSVIDRPKPNAIPAKQLEGVASTYIASCGHGSSGTALGAMGLTAERYVSVPLEGMDVVVRPSTFHLPSDAAVPVILIGPGTGLAPMRAFLQERSHQRAQGDTVGETVLFFGCRRAEEDFIYSEELQGWQADGTLTQLHTAFSRAQEEKVYVQHRIREQGADVWRLLQEGAHVYVCGATNMGSDVAIALRAVAVQHGGESPDTVQQWFDGLHKSGRYVSELWSA
jgi:NADPH-ferrihemoprotein reductase